MGQSDATRQASFRKLQAARGLKQLNVWVPKANYDELRHLLSRLQDDPDLIVRLVDKRTQRLVAS